jgi:hypothetical protein
MPICNGVGGRPGCGQEIIFEKDNATGKWKKPINPDRTPHVCQGPAAGAQTAQANASVASILSAIVPKMDEKQNELREKIKEDIEVTNKANNNTVFNMATDFGKFLAHYYDRTFPLIEAISKAVTDKNMVTAADLYQKQRSDHD